MINENNLNSHVFCYKDSGRSISYIKVTKDETVATDKSIMGIVSSLQDDSDYPNPEQRDIEQEYFIDSKVAKNFKLMKNKSKYADECGENVVCYKNGESLELYNTNLEQSQRIVVTKKEDYSFPDYRMVCPDKKDALKEPTVIMKFKVDYFVTIAEFAKKFQKSKDNLSITLKYFGGKEKITDNDVPVKFELCDVNIPQKAEIYLMQCVK